MLGRLPMDLEIWCCPVCLAPLSPSDVGLRCSVEGRAFREFGGLHVLVRPDQEDLLDDGAGLAMAWKRGEWALNRDEILRLPHLRRLGWRQKARSLQALLALLGSPMRRCVGDLGAGTGWLSYRLSEAGFRCFATDISGDPQVGLGAAGIFDTTPYRFERAIATLDHWPFQSGSLDIAVCNASLHYLPEIRPALSEAARVLRPDGVLIVMNEPVHEDPRSAIKASEDYRAHLRALGGRGKLVDWHRHFVASELETELRRFFPIVQRHNPDYGRRFSVIRRLKSVLLGMELASFPLLEARAR
ncbi:MAG: class I SAM-dependent methyltransferase [Methanobacteriota archaeon]|nr:MAG: class I SAM-dependent methyltransferase [Euryarchaeota archaeon]